MKVFMNTNATLSAMRICQYIISVLLAPAIFSAHAFRVATRAADVAAGAAALSRLTTTTTTWNLESIWKANK